MTAEPVPAALAVLIRDDRVLLVRRRNPPDAGLWGFPGGRVDPGETAPQAAIRELVEETGVSAVPLDRIATLDLCVRDTVGSVRFHYKMTAVRCRYVSGMPRASDDAQAASWVDTRAVLDRALPMSADVDSVLRKALARA